MNTRVRTVVMVSCLLAAAASAQDTPAQAEESQIGDCSGKQEEFPRYTIRSARVSDPFWILRWRKLDTDTLNAVKALAGQRYSFNLVNPVSKMIEAKGWLPETPDVRAEFAYSDIAVENCKDMMLDVVFHVFSARISSTLSSYLEWRTKQIEAPHEAAGVAKLDAPAQLAPEAGFDPGRGFFAGGAARMTFAADAPFKSLELRGAGSTESRTVSATMSGAFDASDRLLSHAEWRLGYGNELMPAAADGQLGQSRLAAQFSGLTRPLRGTVFRFGGMLEGGTSQSEFGTSPVPANTISNTHYTAAKLYGGISENWRKQAFAASFGIQFGSTGDTFHGGWRKLVGDISHQLCLPAGKYRILEVEQRFNAGGIQTPGSIPLAERFFGGNHETPFIPGSDWSIRSNPVIRSIPTNRFYLTAAGIGGDRFFSYNSTTAWTAWSKPVVPKELRSDPQFQKLLNGAIVSQTSVLQNYYATKDSHFTTIRNGMPDIVAKLEKIRTAKDTLLAAAPGPLKPDFRGCSAAITSSVRAAQHARSDKPPAAYGWLPELLPGGLGPLAEVVSECGVDLVAKLAAASIPAPLLVSETGDLDRLAVQLATDFGAIDLSQAKNRAGEDLAYVKRTLDVITKQMTITSVSPVFVFDLARIGPDSTGPNSGNRYGVGGGVRFTLVSTVSFTLGYAANVHARAGEGPGAFFFALSTRNLFE